MAIDKLESPLHDFDIILSGMSDTITAKVSHFAEDLLANMDHCLPTWVTIDNELKYHLHFVNLETCYFACAAFVRSHEHAQRTLAEFYGDDPTPDTPEEIAVCLESARAVLNAQEVSKQLVDKKVVDIIKTKLVAEHLLEIEHEYVYRLVKQGVLSVKESETMFASIHADERALETARKKQVRDLGKEEIRDDIVHHDDTAHKKKDMSTAIHTLRRTGSLRRTSSGEVRASRLAKLAALHQGSQQGASGIRVAPYPGLPEEEEGEGQGRMMIVDERSEKVGKSTERADATTRHSSKNDDDLAFQDIFAGGGSDV